MTTQPSYPIITPFEATPTAIDGLYIITMKQVTDERGTVRELFRLGKDAHRYVPPAISRFMTDNRGGS